MNSINSGLPGLGVEVLNPEVRGNDCTVRELATRQRLESVGGRFSTIVLDEDLASAMSTAGNLHSENLSELGAFLAHILHDFFVIFVIEELIKRDHVEKLQDLGGLEILGGGLGKHLHGIHAHVETGGLCGSNTGANKLKVTVDKFHAVQTFNGQSSVVRVDVFIEGNSLEKLVAKNMGQYGDTQTYPRLLCSSILDQNKRLKVTE